MTSAVKVVVFLRISWSAKIFRFGNFRSMCQLSSLLIDTGQSLNSYSKALWGPDKLYRTKKSKEDFKSRSWSERMDKCNLAVVPSQEFSMILGWNEIWVFKPPKFITQWHHTSFLLLSLVGGKSEMVLGKQDNHLILRFCDQCTDSNQGFRPTCYFQRSSNRKNNRKDSTEVFVN